MIFNATVARKRIEVARALFLSRALLILRFTLPKYGLRSSEVISRIIAVMASSKLMSHMLRGKITLRFAPLQVIDM